MDDGSFDKLAKGIALGRSRRALLKAALGLGAAGIAGRALGRDTEAARRGYPGPFPRGTEVGGPETCDPSTCYGCHQCVNGVCTDQPKTNCYDHTDQCLTSVCAPDGGCRYPFDCRVKEGCCPADQVCNADGACVCKPGTCCGVTCPECRICVDGACKDNPAGSCVQLHCETAFCQSDGTCGYQDDCRTGAGCCSADQTCNADGVCVCKPGTCCGVTCPACQVCANGVCTDNAAGSCPNVACKAPFCEASGACGYQDDCRIGSDCCAADQVCNDEGVCVCKPGTCCGVTCPGCQVCVNGACVGDSSKCGDHTDQCQASVCGIDGACSYPFDCAVRAGCCADGQLCDINTGQCDEKPV